MICESDDGISFSNCVTFQDSSSVPSVIRWKDDTLIAAFQWFPEPFQTNPAWDKVAVKFSYDGGTSWTYPVSITVNGLPPDFQRPFDPTLYAINSDSIRLYYSCGPNTGLPPDSSITTYSAISTDGINYEFEQGKRFISGDTLMVIDPAVIKYKGIWHFQSHIGAPADGSYHGTSDDGLNFTRVADIPSNASHNWLGNYIVVDTVLRFYGCGGSIWFNTSADGNIWNGYTNTNINGGDPAVVQNMTGHFYSIYVGEKYTNLADSYITGNINVFPNPFYDKLYINNESGKPIDYIRITDVTGKIIYCKNDITTSTHQIKLNHLKAGIYIIEVKRENEISSSKLIKY